VCEAAELIWADTLRMALGDRLSTLVSSQGQRLDLAREVASLPASAQLWICGPASMLQAAGRAAADLRFETFCSSGAQPAQAFWVRVPRHGLAFEVPAERSLLDVLNEQGVETLADCQRGECGLCAVDVLEVHGRIDHRDVFLGAAERQDNRRLCACVSRVCDGGIVIDSAWRPDPPSSRSASR
jgi:vanillate O-demethylase ferredoxin subunit